MQDALTVTVALAGLFFSLTCALLLEELMLGGLFHLLRPVRRRVPQTRPQDDLFGTSEKFGPSELK